MAQGSRHDTGDVACLSKKRLKSSKASAAWLIVTITSQLASELKLHCFPHSFGMIEGYMERPPQLHAIAKAAYQ